MKKMKVPCLVRRRSESVSSMSSLLSRDSSSPARHGGTHYQHAKSLESLDRDEEFGPSSVGSAGRNNSRSRSYRTLGCQSTVTSTTSWSSESCSCCYWSSGTSPESDAASHVTYQKLGKYQHHQNKKQDKAVEQQGAKMMSILGCCLDNRRNQSGAWTTSPEYGKCSEKRRSISRSSGSLSADWTSSNDSLYGDSCHVHHGIHAPAPGLLKVPNKRYRLFYPQAFDAFSEQRRPLSSLYILHSSL